MPQTKKSSSKATNLTKKQEREIKRRVDRAHKAAIQWVIDVATQAARIETVLKHEKTSETVRSALDGLLLELSNESKVYVFSPSVAGHFYQKAAYEVHGQPQGLILKTCLRHIDALLAHPNQKTANAIIKFWNGDYHLRPSNDPFPEKVTSRKGASHATN